MVKGCTLLKSGMGKEGNSLLPGPEGQKQGQTATWTWPWEIRTPRYALGGSCCPLGTRAGEKLANSALGDWDRAPSLKGDILRARRPQHASLWHLCGTLWPIKSSPLLLQVVAEPRVEA